MILTTNSQHLYITGGQQRSPRPLFADDTNWYEYRKGLIIQLDVENETSTVLAEHISPTLPETNESRPTLFKSASLKDDKFFVCTLTEILIYSLPDFRQIGYLSLPYLNDTHHVCPTPGGNLLIASSGLDLVMEVNMEGKILREWNTLGEDPWARFSREIDYRFISTKPHKSHPNYVFLIDDDIWATRFYQKDAVCLNKPGLRIEIGVGTPHDGLVSGTHVYFTTVNGHVVIANKQSLKIEECIDLNSLHDYGRPLGWCRGLLLENNLMWVGFSRIRPTKFRENVEWVKRSIKSTMHPVLPTKYRPKGQWAKGPVKRELPTHLALYDLEKRECLREVDLEPHGISAVFSILPAIQAKDRHGESSIASASVA